MKFGPALLAAAFPWLAPGPAAAEPSPLFDHDVVWSAAPAQAETDLERAVSAWKADLGVHGVRPFFNYWGDFLANPVGGRTQAAAWMQLLVTGAEISLADPLGWSGGSLTVSVTDAAGSNLSLPVGNVFTLSQAYVMNTFALYQLYLKQTLLDGRLEFVAGRFAPGQNFASLPALGLVVSGGVNGNPVSLFLNAPFQATGSASWAARAKYRTPDFFAEAGVFQASPRADNPAYHGADFSIRPGDGLLVMAEFGWTPTLGGGADGKTSPAPAEKKGLYTVGGYFAHYATPTFGGGIEDQLFGFYALGQQTVWQAPGQSVSLWGGVTWSPQEDVAEMPVMGFGGAIWQGPVPGRPQDRLLGSVVSGGFSRAYARAQAAAGAGRPTAETVLEASYIVQLTAHLQVQPDVQWVLHPGGTGTVPDALVIGFQVAVTF
jgi:porin